MNEALETLSAGKLLHVKVSGKLTKQDYETFVPAIDDQIREYGKIRVLFEMRDFHGWTAGALWEDMKFDLKHWRDIERLAIVGESKWEAGMAAFCRPFTAAKLRYFDQTRLDDARAWIDSD